MDRTRAFIIPWLVLVLLLLLLIFVSSDSIILNTFNNSQSQENISFASGNVTRYIDIAKTAYVNEAFLNLTGLSQGKGQNITTYVNYSFESSNEGWNNISIAPAIVTRETNTSCSVGNSCFMVDTYVSTNGITLVNRTYDFTNGLKFCMDANVTSNGTARSNFKISHGSTVLTTSIDIETGFYRVCGNSTDVDTGQGELKVEWKSAGVGSNEFRFFLDNFTIYNTTTSYPGNVSLEVGGNDGSPEWIYLGDFSQVNNRTSNFSASLNGALNNVSCNCIGCDGNAHPKGSVGFESTRCRIPFEFHSDNLGVININSLYINYTNRTDLLIPNVTNASIQTTSFTSNTSLFGYCTSDNFFMEKQTYMFTWNFNGVANISYYRGNFSLPTDKYFNLSSETSSLTNGDFQFTVNSSGTQLVVLNQGLGSSSNPEEVDCSHAVYSSMNKVITNGSFYCINSSVSKIWKIQVISNDTSLGFKLWKNPFGESNTSVEVDELLFPDIYDGNWSLSCQSNNGTISPRNGTAERTLNSTIVNSSTILKDFHPPYINNIIYPASTTYGSNIGIPLNFTVLDKATSISCVYYVKNSSGAYDLSNTSSCANTTFNLSSTGVYTLTIYGFDILNNTNISTRTFEVSLNNPAITLNAPTNNSWFNTNSNISINFTALDSDGISSCDLYSNFTGVWGINQSFSPVVNNTLINTLRNLTEGFYTFGMACNDTLNNIGSNFVNTSFGVDSIDPNITINELSTSAGSQTLTLGVIASDTNVNYCQYSIYNDANNIDGLNSNISFACTNGSLSYTNPTVTSYGTYTMRAYVYDKAARSDYTDQVFSISSAGITTQGGGGGGSQVLVVGNVTGNVEPDVGFTYIIFTPFSPYEKPTTISFEVNLEVDACALEKGEYSCFANTTTRRVQVTNYAHITEDTNEFLFSTNDTLYIYTSSQELIKVPIQFSIINFHYYIPVELGFENAGFQKQSLLFFYDTHGNAIGIKVWWVALIIVSLGGYIIWRITRSVRSRRRNNKIRQVQLDRILKNLGGK